MPVFQTSTESKMTQSIKKKNYEATNAYFKSSKGLISVFVETSVVRRKRVVPAHREYSPYKLSEIVE